MLALDVGAALEPAQATSCETGIAVSRRHDLHRSEIPLSIVHQSIISIVFRMRGEHAITADCAVYFLLALFPGERLSSGLSPSWWTARLFAQV